MKGRMGLLIAVAAGLFAVIAMALYLNAREKELLELSALQDVVVTTRDVLANTPLDERVIQVAKIPRRYVQPGSIATPAEVVGRVAAVPMPKGSQVTGTSLLEGGRESLAVNVPRGMRAVALAVDDITGVGGQLRIGNFVDVLGVFEYGVPSGSQGGQITYSQQRTEVITIAQNVQIIAIGGDPNSVAPAEPEPPPAGDGPVPAAAQQQIAIANVSLLLTPSQVQELVLAQQIGTLSVSLRSSLDSAPVELPRLDEGTFLKIPMPLKPRTRPAWREMRGSPQGF